MLCRPRNVCFQAVDEAVDDDRIGRGETQLMDCTIRVASLNDAESISRVIIAALREANAKDYPATVIAQVEQSFLPASVSELLA